LNKAYRLQMPGKAWTNIHWAGMNIQNLKESIAGVAAKKELKGIENVNGEIESFIRGELKLAVKEWAITPPGLLFTE